MQSGQKRFKLSLSIFPLLITRTNSRSFFHLLIKSILILIPLGFLLWGIEKSMHWPLIHDAPIMNYIAQALINGAVPYKDIFDMNMPGVYAIHIAILSFIGKSSLAFRVFDLGWLLATLIGLYYFCKPISKWAGVLAALLFGLYHLSIGPISSGQRDYLLLLFIIFGCLFTARAITETTKNNLFLFAAGFCFGSAILIKPFVIIMAFLCTIMFLWKWRSHNGSLLHVMSIFLIGFAIPLIIACVWLLLSGALVYFLDIFFNYLAIYGNILREPIGKLLYTLFWNPMVIPLITLGIPIVNSRSFRKPEVIIAIIGVFYGVFHFIAQGQGFFYHVYPFTFFILLLGAFLIDENLNGRSLNQAIATFCALLLFLSLGVKLNNVFNSDNSVSGLKPSVIPLVLDIQSFNLSKNDSVQTLGSTNGGIHALYLLGISQPTRIIYDIQLLNNIDHPYIQNLRNEFISDLSSSPPKLIIIMDMSWGLSVGTLEPLTTFPEFVDLLAAKYNLTIDHPGYDIYLRKKQ